jgi:hypothetical protein
MCRHAKGRLIIVKLHSSFFRNINYNSATDTDNVVILNTSTFFAHSFYRKYWICTWYETLLTGNEFTPCPNYHMFLWCYLCSLFVESFSVVTVSLLKCLFLLIELLMSWLLWHSDCTRLSRFPVELQSLLTTHEHEQKKAKYMDILKILWHLNFSVFVKW